ncbi:MAG TPA: methylenetetrahydrofolate reductase [NAD(P)H] [Firmicutes bacterium]|nr:methylenetetrahydrofolate reductase [NAD(P)H] [Bacillota bacterium]
MHIKDLFSNQKPVVSVEVFPPKPESPLDTVISTIEAVKDLNPDFISVTYGAGGSSRAYTVEIADMVKNQYGIETLAHLTCVGTGKDEIDDMLAQLRSKNIENILALRGDMPQDENTGKFDYTYAKDLITYIRSDSSFCIGAACYPEGHIDCDSLDLDLKHLQQKVSSGADFLITQLFFDNELFYSFKERLDALGIHCPVSAGIMPVINKKQIERITNLCGATISPRLKKIMETYADKPEALKKAGVAYATEQIIDLLSSGVDGIHLYAMNRPEVAQKIFADIKDVRGSCEHEHQLQ